MPNTAYSRRYVAATEQYPDAYARHCKEVYGFAPPDIERLLHMHDKLSYGGKLSQTDTKELQRLHPRNAAAMPGVVAAFNAAHGPQRANLFLAAISSDAAGLDGRFGDVGDDYKHVKKVADVYRTESYAEAIAAKQDGGRIRPDRPARVEDPLSTRSLIARQFEEPGMREAVEMINEGWPRASQLGREILADKLDRATTTLYADDNASMRDTVTAAYDSEAIEAEGRDQGWLPAED